MRFSPASVLCLLLGVSVASMAQSPTPTPTDDVLRIKADLIQTGVSVVNKNGAFVTGLKREDFQLFVDGKVVLPLFFETVRIGSEGAKPGSARTTAQLPDVPRTMVFVVDDLHLSADSITRTRRTVQRFIENELLPGDRLAIVGSSGKVGFLQQFTNDKEMLMAACDRLVYSQKTADEAGPPPMTEFDAQSIDRGDRDVTNAFIAQTLRYNPGMNRSQANSVVQARSRGILNIARSFTQSTLNALEAAATQAGKFPGRKAVYYFSDGLLLDPGNTNTPDQLRKITSAAARSNVVIYSFDAKGLDASMPTGDGSSSVALAMSQRAAESFERQDALAYVAHNTGGRFIHNTNDIKGNLSTVTQEAFQYYLLAWEPSEDSTGRFHKIEVKVPGRADVKVSYQAGYLDRAKDAVTPPAGPLPATPVDPAETMSSRLPTYLSLAYLQIGNEGPSLTASVAVDPAAVKFVEQKADVELTIRLFDQNGKQEAAFKAPLQVTAGSADLTGAPYITYEYHRVLKPGLYQVRVRSLDPRTGISGAAAAWLQIPDGSKRRSLSTLVLGEVRIDPKNGRIVDRKIDNRFLPDSTLQYLGFIYGPSAQALSKNVEVKAEVLQASTALLTRPGSIISVEGDNDKRTTFSGDLALNSLSPGTYELRVTVSSTNETPLIRRAYFEIR